MLYNRHMDKDRQAFEELLDILDRVMNRLGSMHLKPRDFGTGVPLHRSEIHTVQAIGQHPEINVTRLADHMGVTKGAVSQTIARLETKGLVRRKHPRDNSREVLLELTETGRVGYENHEAMHMETFHIVQRLFEDQAGRRTRRLRAAMLDLERVLDEHAGSHG